MSTHLHLFSRTDDNYAIQAPKSGPPLAKQSLILNYLRSSNNVHTLKELEKSLPSIASINGMQVKDYMQALSDEGQIRVEKIGSGNWYWSFMSEERSAREGVHQALTEELGKLERGAGELRAAIQAAEDARDKDGEDCAEDPRQNLLMEREARLMELAKLRADLKEYSDCDPQEVVRKREEVEGLKAKASRWTDNIYCLEEYFKEITGGDREGLENLRRQYYEGEYVEGEGLREVET